ncbi:MAG: lipocalin family protein [Mucilaginibacter sp.]|nr:lipocalin family protein [Mucilaginibacter sp.]
MKKICFLLCCLLMAVSACKKENTAFGNKLLGKWLLQKVEYTDYDVNNKIIGHATSGFSATDYMLFDKDKTGETVTDDRTPFGPQIRKFTYNIDQSNVNIKYQYDTKAKTYKIKVVNENQVILTYNYDPWEDSIVNEKAETYLIRP